MPLASTTSSNASGSDPSSCRTKGEGSDPFPNLSGVAPSVFGLGGSEGVEDLWPNEVRDIAVADRIRVVAVGGLAIS